MLTKIEYEWIGWISIIALQSLEIKLAMIMHDLILQFVIELFNCPVHFLVWSPIFKSKEINWVELLVESLLEWDQRLIVILL